MRMRHLHPALSPAPPRPAPPTGLGGAARHPLPRAGLRYPGGHLQEVGSQRMSFSDLGFWVFKQNVLGA